MNNDYDNIISVENLCEAWREFARGKRKKKDVAEFVLNLPRNIYDLHRALKNKTYRHGAYEAFSISDPKPRIIHKAMVRDRLLHRAIYRQLYSFFDKTFIFDSFSCRESKGTHKAVNRFRDYFRAVSKNNTKTCFVLKCDIKKFFASIDHKILLEILEKQISDDNVIWLLKEVIGSSHVEFGKGLPLGNLTSQLFSNIYLDELDQFMKSELKVNYYIRYADDFVIFGRDREWLDSILRYIVVFLRGQLKLDLHPDKIFIKTVCSGVDYLGWVHFPNHRVLRTSTKKRMFRSLMNNPKLGALNSYLGLLKHGNTRKLQSKISHFKKQGSTFLSS